MKHLHLILAGLFSLCGIFCHAQFLSSEEEVVTLNTKEGDLNGKLLLPGGVKTCPVVLLIPGSGPTDMDGNSLIANMKNNSLKFLAEGLVKNGIASLRFDKRGIGTSAAAAKEESELRFEDYVNDVKGWIGYLVKDKRFTFVTIAGHSEGSLTGMLACRDQPKVKGFISIAGAGRPAYEVIEEQLATQPEKMRKEAISIHESLKAGKGVDQVSADLQTLYRPSVQPYLISWFKYNPQTAIAALKIPVLIVQGKKDIQVALKDAELLKKAYPVAELLLIDEMNHVLKDCDTMDIKQQLPTYMDPSLPVNTTLIASLCTFIKKEK
ncbi:alpha/beta hydrolase [Phocaeicola sp.]